MARIPTLGPALRVLDTRVARRLPKEVQPVYATPEHRAWRAQVLRRAGFRCEWPGCGRSGVRLFADHIVELKDGGSPFDPSNGQALCGHHHSLKTASARVDRARG